ncbi:hypothetical protein COX08_03630 [Candidatus Beckwithbacteria bacterium CG23_combo_of_CG06-09_8_20_14_all_34_8]|uniref:VTT domain-containing protein n=1 Tax=Candidatus Beckwithbacteria bacterium CG23_combo_of_CG06-09_8_20_14_all_34_8 TaxID=1974497 RepID=A0A2H0B5Q8_9BACT|nr:MAG: hypothetical protein COX08_03630 [Candidatus Beckwithbacteria bacterium CG23_combo_of_CG06-09_8_20_14_all_34_8]
MRFRTYLFITGFICFSIVIFILFKKYLGNIEHLINSLGLIGIIFSFALYPLIAFTPLPSDPISILVIAIYHPLLTFLIIWLGNTTIALIEYYIGHHLNKKINYADKITNLPFGLGKLPIESTKMLLLGRMISGYGNKFISMIAGAKQVPLKRYIWTTALTNMWGALIFTIGGHGLKNIIHLLIAIFRF